MERLFDITGWYHSLQKAPAASCNDSTYSRRAFADRLLLIAGLGDILVIVGSLLLGFYLRFVSPLVELGLRHDSITLHSYAGYLALGAITLITVLASLGLYERQRLLYFRGVAELILKGWAMWIMTLLTIAMVFHFVPSISRGYLALASVILIVSLCGWRHVLHCICQRESVAGQLRERVLLVGTKDDAARVCEAIRRASETPYEVVGFVCSRQEILADDDSVALTQRGTYKQLPQLLQACSTDVVIFTDPNATREQIVEVATWCEHEMVQFQLVPSYFKVLVTGLHLQNVSGLPLLGISRLPLNQFGNRVLKRAIDVIGAIVGLVLSAPLLAIFGALVYLESPGPVVHRQRRLGRKGRVFSMLKIRSMRLDAERDGTIGWTTKDDPRRLRIGAVMRRWNIDEVPQFWNVLRGEMSLVGPRPERPELIANFKHEITHYNARHVAKPGITGWAQINGLRGDTDLTERVRHDLYYMENWSLWLDLQTMILTFFKRTNAC